MKHAGRFMALPANERRLFLVAVPVVVGARLCLSVLPFPLLRRCWDRLMRAAAAAPPVTAGSPVEVGRAVTRASRLVPGATCLTQALAAQLLLAAARRHGALHVGVARDERGRLIAHAWVESDGRVVVGGTETGRFTRLLSLAGGKPP